MSGVKRFWMQAGDGPGVYPTEDAEGDWVAYGDYDTLRTANQRLEGEVARLREALEDLLGCPANVVQATVPKAGIEAAPPYQVVLDVSVSLTRWRKAKAALSAANGEVTE